MCNYSVELFRGGDIKSLGMYTLPDAYRVFSRSISRVESGEYDSVCIFDYDDSFPYDTIAQFHSYDVERNISRRMELIMENFTYSVDVFLSGADGHILNACKTNSIVEAYRYFADELELVELDIADSVVIFERDDSGSLDIVAAVNSFDC